MKALLAATLLAALCVGCSDDPRLVPIYEEIIAAQRVSIQALKSHVAYQNETIAAQQEIIDALRKRP